MRAVTTPLSTRDLTPGPSGRSLCPPTPPRARPQGRHARAAQGRIWHVVVGALIGAALVTASTSASAATLCGLQEWAKISHPDFAYAYRWCGDQKLVIGLADGTNPARTFGIHVIYDGALHGVPHGAGTGYYPLIIGPPRGTNPRIRTFNKLLKLKLWGSAEHGCDDAGYDQVVVDIQAQTLAGGVEVTIDIDGVVYFIWPPEGALTVYEDSGWGVSYFVNMMNGNYWLDLASALQQFTYLGTLDLQMHTDTAGEMHFHTTPTSDLLEVDFDHICEHDPLPPKPQMTFTTTVGP
ncbi:MAG: hypothetical protein Tsb0020_37210 [Haliangiales bacterium]